MSAPQFSVTLNPEQVARQRPGYGTCLKQTTAKLHAMSCMHWAWMTPRSFNGSPRGPDGSLGIKLPAGQYGDTISSCQNDAWTYP
jgi:hypothetical protein